MLAEIFMLRMEANVRLEAKPDRFVPLDSVGLSVVPKAPAPRGNAKV